MNQNPEQIARDKIDKMLEECGWIIQSKKRINLNKGIGIAVREYYTDVGPADYILFVDKKPVGVIEAKKEEEGYKLTVVEEQSAEYAFSKLKYLNNEPLPFVYESTGLITRFTDYRDPKPRSREVFTFFKPQTLREMLRVKQTLRKRLFSIPELQINGLRECQINAITNLDKSLKENRPRALIQMATGSGKTFTAITFIYRLIKYADAKRILFLVDTKNLGEQAEQEFMSYVPNDDNRKFTELYNVQRLKTSYVSTDSQVCISTIQRMYSLLKGEELDESSEETNPAEFNLEPKESNPVVYNSKLPIEFFDFIVIDECHRSIYNLWRQVLEYFDSFLIGLTATPDNRTFGFFNQNIVSEYTHEEAIADGVNVGYNIFQIETEISKKGSAIWKGEFIDRREKMSRKKRWEQLDEDVEYSSKKLDNEVVNPSQIRAIIKTFRERWNEMFPGREELPKTLIFAKTDSHADDIIQIVREEFAEGNEFCKKITYRAEEDPKSVLAQFRNNYNPRIAVTVDMIATGTDVKALECLIFMRDVKSKNYFEQMKGRGTRIISLDDLRRVTPSATYTKDHFVIVDAIGVTKSIKTDSRPLERKPTVALKDLLNAVAVGSRAEDVFITLAGRLGRLEKQLTDKEKKAFKEKTNGITINKVIKNLINAFDEDKIDEKARSIYNIPVCQEPTVEQISSAQDKLIDVASNVFDGEFNEFIESLRKAHDQIIDIVNLDRVTYAGWDKQSKNDSNEIIEEFKTYIEENKNDILALQIFYNQPYRRKDITFNMIKELLERIKKNKPNLAPLRVWQAYEQVEKVNGENPKDELVALVSLIRRVTNIDNILTSYDKVVNKNFQEWVFKKQAGPIKFSAEQMEWLRMIKDHISTSFHIDIDDFDYEPFDAKGGLGKMYILFEDKTNEIIEELNEGLVS